jgi:manganese efflux pump family protein
MLTLTVVLTAIGLAMDAVAVSIASGLSAHQLRRRDALKMAFFFGAFQALMPFLGFMLGLSVADWIATWGTWIAFIVLVALGVNMIIDARHANDGTEELHQSPFQTKKLTALAIATSIDAFAVGVSFSLLDSGLLVTCATIGIITFMLCLPAVWFAAKLGRHFAKRAEIFGGVVLIIIGCKILLSHFLNGT